MPRSFSASRCFRSIGPLVCSALLVAVAGCGSDGRPDEESGDVTAPQVATFEVAGREQFKILLASQELVDQAAAQLSGEADSQFPVGDVVRDDPGVNAPWSWHIDPDTVVFTRNAIEVCDGVPSFVEDRTVTSDQYCPWSAVLIELTPP